MLTAAAPVLDDCLDGCAGRFGFVLEASSAASSSGMAFGTLSLTLLLVDSRSRLLSFDVELVCENMRLNRVVKVGFFWGVGRDWRSDESRASPFACDGSREAAGGRLVSLLCELTEVEDAVGAGEVCTLGWALGWALGRLLEGAEVGPGDCGSVTAMVSPSFVR